MCLCRIQLLFNHLNYECAINLMLMNLTENLFCFSSQVAAYCVLYNSLKKLIPLLTLPWREVTPLFLTQKRNLSIFEEFFFSSQKHFLLKENGECLILIVLVFSHRSTLRTMKLLLLLFQLGLILRADAQTPDACALSPTNRAPGLYHHFLQHVLQFKKTLKLPVICSKYFYFSSPREL